MRPLLSALVEAMPQATMVQGDRFGGVAAGLAYAGRSFRVLPEAR